MFDIRKRISYIYGHCCPITGQRRRPENPLVLIQCSHDNPLKNKKEIRPWRTIIPCSLSY